MSTLRAVYTNLRAARTAIKDVGRLRQIAAVLVRHGFGHFVEAWSLQDKFILNLLLEKRDTTDERLTVYERVGQAVQELGPTFVKLGQILSTRPDLIPQPMCAQFARLQNDVLPITFEAAKEVVETSLGAPLEELFAEFDDKPLACASIAQVHLAQLPGGEEVVVKIQRPGIEDTITSDISILYFVARQIEATIPEATALQPVSIAREFEKAILKELDFNHEANHLERFDRNFSDWPSVHIPKLYREQSTKRVLTMERLRGVKITDAPARGFEMEPIARECVRALFKMAFDDGFFHGDLHPGNLFVLDSGQIGLIDFGLVGRMTQTMKDHVADLLLAVVSHDFEGVARSFYEISIRTGKVDYPAFEQDTVELMERYFLHKTLAEVDFGAYLRELVEGAVRHDVKVPPDYTMFFKAIMTVEGIGKAIAPDLDLVSECRPYVEALVVERYSPARVIRTAVETLQAFGRIGQQFPLTANEVLRRIDDGQMAIGVEYTQIERLERGREVRTNRTLAMALGIALLLVAALVKDEASFTLLGFPGFSLLATLGGLGLTGRVLLRIARTGRY